MNSVYIGTDIDEVVYLIDRDSCGDKYGLETYEVKTEEDMKANARDTTPEDLGYETKGIEQWFDYDKFAEDMEDDWYQANDIVDEFERNNETQYLCSRGRYHLIEWFSKKAIISWERYKEVFSWEQGLTEGLFEELAKLINMYKLDGKLDIDAFNKWADKCLELPSDLEEENESDGN